MSRGNGTIYPTPVEATTMLVLEETLEKADQFERLAGYAQQQAAMNEALMRGAATPDYTPPVAYVERNAVRGDAAVFALACRHLGYDTLVSVDELADISLLILRPRDSVTNALSKLAEDPTMENRIGGTRRESRTSHILLAGLILGAI